MTMQAAETANGHGASRAKPAPPRGSKLDTCTYQTNGPDEPTTECGRPTVVVFTLPEARLSRGHWEPEHYPRCHIHSRSGTRAKMALAGYTVTEIE